jgi:CxxC motif-containing protein (DUF1111 family)
MNRMALGAAIAAVCVSGVALATTAVLRADLSSDDRARVAAITAPTTDFTRAERYEALAAGAQTVRDQALNRDIYSHPAPNLPFEGRQRFQLGNGLFRRDWVAAPASTHASDGLGPLFNARSCQGCHLKDGRGVVPVGDEPAVSLFLRLSVPAKTDAERKLLAERRAATLPEPTYGGQLQNFAVQGLPAEGRMQVDYTETTIALNGGETAKLRMPRYRVTELGFGPMRDDVLLSPRLAPPMLGLGLLQAIHPDDILRGVRKQPDADGVRGKAAYVRDEHGELQLGRYGWKSGQHTVASQGAHAFAGDMGLSTPLLTDHAGDCTAGESACRAQPHGMQQALGDSEVSAEMMQLVAFYSENVGVPARRDIDDPVVLAGKQLFYASGCTACHTPKFVTRRDAPQPEHRFQLIWPYSDLLLHDMGEGLADHRPDGDASGSEWRTPPLWGIGLATTVNERATFLHDGRARTLLEAVLWHGGEAEKAKQRVVDMEPAQRRALIRFVESL